jgi:hypothetical protein
MAWRVLDIGDQTWNVSFAAERRANSEQWGLVLSFRSAGPASRSFWAPYPIQASSKAAIYTRAETLSDQELASVLTEHLARQ